MGKYLGEYQPVTLPALQKRKGTAEKISMVTCYDAAFAKIVDASPIDMVLVGDSMGNVVLGFSNTLSVTMDHMVHHCAAVSRGLKRPFLVGDMPFGSFQVSVAECVRNAVRLMQEGGVQAVKLEGGHEVCPHIEALTQSGIPVVAHLGLTPQHIHALGGYKVQGKEQDAGKKLIAAAKAVEAAGASFLVLELVPEELAQAISAAIKIPTIGIGAGRHTDGQVLVLHDLLGFNPDFKPKFLKQYANFYDVTKKALADYHHDVQAGEFPGDEHAFH